MKLVSHLFSLIICPSNLPLGTQIAPTITGGLLGDGYGFPSSHSQYMAYFATFLLMHLSFRHTFPSYGPGLRWLDVLQRTVLYSVIVTWSVGVAFSRWVILELSCLPLRK